jgi:hypothetical protein
VLSAVQPYKGPHLTSLQEAPPEEHSSERRKNILSPLHKLSNCEKQNNLKREEGEFTDLEKKRDFFGLFLFMYDIQHCFTCRPSDSTVSEDAGIELRTVATTALAVRRSNLSARYRPHSARSHPLINTYVDNDLLHLLQGMGHVVFALDEKMTPFSLDIAKPYIYLIYCGDSPPMCASPVKGMLN